MELYDIVVIGAGPAGSVASAYLNNQGKKVLVLEKETMPRFVIGESLLPRCLNDLDESGLLEAVEAANFQVKTGATFNKGASQLAFDFSNQYYDGHKYAWQVKRADFDKILIDEAENQGVEVRYNCTVTDIKTSASTQVISYTDKEGLNVNVEAKFIIDASGYGRVIPNLFDLNAPSQLPARGSVFTHVIDKNRTTTEAENIFVHAFNNNESWIWAIPFSDGTTSIGVVGANDFVKELAENNGEKFLEFMGSFKDLKGRFKDVETLFDTRSIYGYSIGIKKMYGEGFVLCGNTIEFLDPIFSSGVTLATASGLIAAKSALKQINGEPMDWQKDYEDLIMEGVEVFRSYVNGWYDGTLQSIIFAPEINTDFQKQICSVLAGYVWDTTNPFIKKHKTILKTLSTIIEINSK